MFYLDCHPAIIFQWYFVIFASNFKRWEIFMRTNIIRKTNWKYFAKTLLAIRIANLFFWRIDLQTSSWVNFTNFLHAAFTHAKNTVKPSVFFALLGSFWKSCWQNVVEIDTWCQFHHGSMSSFYVCRSQKCKKIDNLTVFFCPFRIFMHKSCA